MNDDIKIDDIVKDIYPRETEKIFTEKAELVGAREEYEENLSIRMAKIEDKELAERFSKEFRKRMVAEMKYYRQCGVPSKEERDARISKLQEEVQESINSKEPKEETVNQEKEQPKKERSMLDGIPEAARVDNEYNTEEAKRGKTAVVKSIEEEKQQTNKETQENGNER